MYKDTQDSIQKKFPTRKHKHLTKGDVGIASKGDVGIQE
jgi:hypothetical protein